MLVASQHPATQVTQVLSSLNKIVFNESNLFIIVPATNFFHLSNLII